MNKLFTEKKLSWKFIILFSIIVALIVGGLNCIPLFRDTSLTDIAIYMDMWIVLAIFIIMNQKNAKDAVLKCFIFFLISQPLIYLLEVLVNVVFYNENFIENFNLYFRNYYIGAGWFRWTLLTIPGSFIAYQVKKQNILSSLILSVATIYLSLRGSNELLKCITNHFPYHLLNSLLCLFFAYYLIFILLKNKKERIISFILTTVGIIIGIILFINSTKPQNMKFDQLIFLNNDININSIEILDKSLATYKYDKETNLLTVYPTENNGETKLIIKDKNDNEYIYI